MSRVDDKRPIRVGDWVQSKATQIISVNMGYILVDIGAKVNGARAYVWVSVDSVTPCDPPRVESWHSDEPLINRVLRAITDGKTRFAEICSAATGMDYLLAVEYALASLKRKGLIVFVRAGLAGAPKGGGWKLTGGAK